tara:strand:- start:34260 stop:34454 length:195 start_codon:yes stop_codon:yes gene_type:complete
MNKGRKQLQQEVGELVLVKPNGEQVFIAHAIKHHKISEKLGRWTWGGKVWMPRGYEAELKAVEQ